MIQRKQSVFLLLAAIVGIISLCMPIGIFKPVELGVDSVMYNLWIQDGNGSLDFSVAPLFCIALLSVVISGATIFLFNNRKLQIKLCSWNMLLLIVWYIAYGVIAYLHKSSVNAEFKLSFAAVLPLIAIILVFMASKGVKADEALIRAADRIR